VLVASLSAALIAGRGDFDDSSRRAAVDKVDKHLVGKENAKSD